MPFVTALAQRESRSTHLTYMHGEYSNDERVEGASAQTRELEVFSRGLVATLDVTADQAKISNKPTRAKA